MSDADPDFVKWLQGAPGDTVFLVELARDREKTINLRVLARKVVELERRLATLEGKP